MRVELLWLAVLGVVGWRVWGWWEWHDGLIAGDAVKVVQVVGRVDQRWSNMTYEWRGLRVECPVAIAGCSDLNDLPGLVRLRWIGKVEDWVIGGDIVGKKAVVSQLELIYPNEGQALSWVSVVYTRLNQLKMSVVKVYKSMLGEPGASLMAGIVLGTRENMPDWFYDALVETGTLHVIAASGYNITVVAQALLVLCLHFLRRSRALIVSVVGILMYVVLAGGSPAVVRAGLMGLLVFGAAGLGRMYMASFGLVVSVVGMLLVWPWMVVDVSFQLSVAATAGILYGYEPIARSLRRLGEILNPTRDPSAVEKQTASRSAQDDKAGMDSLPALSNPVGDVLGKLVQTDLATTLAATLATLPITVVTFGRMSLISPLVNVLVLWLVPPIMALGALIGIVGLVLPTVAGVLSWLAWPMLEVFVWVIEVFAKVPYASVELVGVGWMLGVGWWVVLVGWWGMEK